MPRVGPSPIILAFAAALLMCCAAVIAQGQFWHDPSVLEHSDFAANALQITRAKSFTELLGNYSRWQFNHPGPAFFYWYALGERVLFDGLHVVGSPYAAHLLAGAFLQTFLFALALLIIAQELALPWFLPVAMLAAVAHFSGVQGVVFSIWPPLVLLAPMMAFIVACASVAAGRAQWFPLLALTGVLLVHGHVAQPLFVVPLTLLALGILLRREGRTVLGRHRLAFAAGTAIVLIGLLPIALDALRGAQSNLALILAHLKGHAAAQHPVSLAVGYLLGFVTYDLEGAFVPTYLPGEIAHFTGLGDYVWRHAALFVALAAAMLAGAVVIRRGAVAGKPFLAMLSCFAVAAAMLTLAWAIFQDGPLYRFNTQFFNAVLSLLYLVPVIAVAILIERMRRPLAAAALLGAGAVLVLTFAPGRFVVNYVEGSVRAPGVSDALREAVLKTGHGALYLTGDPKHWTTALMIANALERRGVRVFAPPEFWIWFGDGNRAHARPQMTAEGRLVDGGGEFSFPGESGGLVLVRE